jgi:hypothetical protein
MLPTRIIWGVVLEGEHGSGWRGHTPAAATLDEAYDLAQPLEREQRGGVPGRGSHRCTRIVGGTHSERRVGPIRELDDEVWINALPDPDERDLLAAQRMMGMGDSHQFRRWLGKWGSVL